MSKLILPFDTETTKMVEWKEPSGGDNQPHIVQLAAVLVEEDTRKIIQSMNVIIKPDGWGESVQEALDQHGITHEYAMDVGIPEQTALDMFLCLWNGRKRVAFNTTFDNRIIRIGLMRYFSEKVQEEWKAGEYECAMQMARKDMGVKSVKLVDAYKHYTGNELVDAHSAMADATAAMAVYFTIKDRQ